MNHRARLFRLRLPELKTAPIVAAQARIPTANLRQLRLHLQKQYADTINFGAIYLTINGEAANTICDKRRGLNGYVINCDLESKPRFRLRPGKNVIEITATNNLKRSYYASYVLLAGGTSVPDDAVAGVTIESVAADSGDDRQPPDIHLTLPKGAVRLTKATDKVRVQGIVTDELSQINSVSINGSPATLAPASAGGKSGAAKASGAFRAQANARAFEGLVSVNAGSSIVIEAQDRAGNVTRLNLPVRGREAAVSSEFSGRKFAVIIGVSRYKFQDGGLRNLEYADADSRSVRDFLQSREGGGFAPGDILYLENEGATTTGVRDALTRFLPKAGANDLIFIFVAGHGAPDPYEPQNLYFLLHDSKVADMKKTALPMTELKNFLDNQTRAQRIVVFIDACHSAGLSGAKLVTGRGLEHTENNVFNLYAAKLFTDTGRAVLTSSDVTEISQESQSWGGGHGVFTWALLEGLGGEADDNGDHLITAGELFEFVYNRVRDQTNFTQNPQALAGLNKDLPLAVARK